MSLVIEDFTGLTDASITAAWIPVTSSNLCFRSGTTAGTSTASSQFSPNENSGRAFDGVTAGVTWSTLDGTPQWIQFGFTEDEQRVLRKLRIWHVTNNEPQQQWCKTFGLSGSDDGITFTDAMVGSGWSIAPFWPEGPTVGSPSAWSIWQTASAAASGSNYDALINNTPYRYYRIGVEDSYNPTNYIGFREIEFIESGFDAFAEASITTAHASVTSNRSMKLHSATGDVSGTALTANVEFVIAKTLPSSINLSESSIAFDFRSHISCSMD